MEDPQNLDWCLIHNWWSINEQGVLVIMVLFFLYCAVAKEIHGSCQFSLYNSRHKGFRKVRHKRISPSFSHIPVYFKLFRITYFNYIKYVPDHRI